MSVVARYIIRNICENKFRTTLILFSILVSTALFFASNAISDTMMKMFISRMKSYYGSADIIIQPEEKSPSPFFNLARVRSYREDLEHATGIVQGSAKLVYKRNETIHFTLLGIEFDEYNRLNPVNLDTASRLFPFEGRKIILGKSTASRYGLKSGDSISLEINGARHKFRIVGIAVPSGVFINDASSPMGLVPRETLSSFYGFKGRVNLACIKVKDPDDKQEVIERLSKAYNRYTVKEPFTAEEIKELTAGMSTGFMMMSIMVSIISIFIIYTSFKVITMEKLPVIGTFRSIGATREVTNLVLLSESVLYGIIGGLSGCFVGIGILYIMTLITGPDIMNISSSPAGEGGHKVIIHFTPVHLLSAFAFAVILSVASCIVPIVKISRIPVKDIVLNNITTKSKRGKWKPIAGIILAAFAFLGPPFAPKGAAMYVDTACIIFSVLSVVLLVPYVTGAASKIFGKLYTYVFGNIGVLAAKNLRGNHSIINNISLLAIGISSFLMINTVGDSEVKMLTKVFRSANFDVWITSMPKADRSLVNSIRHINGVKDVYAIYKATGIEVTNRDNKRIELIDGVDKNRFPQYWDMDFYGSPKDLLEELYTGRNIILSNTLKHVLDVERGDYISLEMPKGNISYKVIGFVNTPMSDGSYAIVPERYLKQDTLLSFYSNIFIKTDGEPEQVKDELYKRFAKLKPSIKTVKEMEEYERQALANTFLILKGFPVLTLVIGIFGVLNNLIISFIERKRSIAVLRSIGMSRKQVLQMILAEGVTGGVIGSLIGIAAGLLLIWNVPFTMMAIGMLITIAYPFGMLYVYLLLGIIIFLTASISPAVKSSRLNIIEAIKYE